jgi:riboflavin kinase/FMN adenylyltransferase
LKDVPAGPSVVTVGNFDGVHLGHRAIIRTLVQEARSKNLRSAVLTFDPHPIQVLFPNRKFQRIFSREDQVSEMEKLGVDLLTVEPFTRELSRLTAEEFLKNCLFKIFNPKLVIVGYDFAFGAGRSGSIPELLEFAKRWNFELMIIPPQKLQGAVISSSAIRKLVAEGDVETASQFLGRPYYLEGVVEQGAQRGKGLGLPTANLQTKADLLPAPGVYATRTRVDGDSHLSVTNVGRNPTFVENGDLKIETHVLDFEGGLYGRPIRIEFRRRLRDERKFNSVEELKAQIKQDILKAREGE